MKSYFILFLLVLFSCSFITLEDKNSNIVINVNVKKKPELGFVISYQRDVFRPVNFDEDGHATIIIKI